MMHPVHVAPCVHSNKSLRVSISFEISAICCSVMFMVLVKSFHGASSTEQNAAQLDLDQPACLSTAPLHWTHIKPIAPLLACPPPPPCQTPAHTVNAKLSWIRRKSVTGRICRTRTANTVRALVSVSSSAFIFGWWVNGGGGGGGVGFCFQQIDYVCTVEASAMPLPRPPKPSQPVRLLDIPSRILRESVTTLCKRGS